MDENGNHYSIFKSVAFSNQKRTLKDSPKLAAEPFNFKLTGSMIHVRLEFQGHYGEPPLDLEIDAEEIKS